MTYLLRRVKHYAHETGPEDERDGPARHVRPWNRCPSNVNPTGATSGSPSADTVACVQASGISN